MKNHVFTSDQKLKWWGNGEWVEEIDMEDWEYKDVKCRILRVAKRDGPNGEHISGGSINGYVGVPKDHPWATKSHYDDIDAEVHGGLTFFEKYDNGESWIGFDTAHSGDLVPSLEKFKKDHMTPDPRIEKYKEDYPDSPIWNKTYRNVSYVKRECESLVDQLLEAATNTPPSDPKH